MRNCLKTQLKESVQNNNLKYLGMFPAITKTTGGSIKIYAKAGTKVKSSTSFVVKSADGSTTIASNVTEYVLPTQDGYRIVSTVDMQKFYFDTYTIWMFSSEDSNWVLQPIVLNISDMAYYLSKIEPSELDYMKDINFTGLISGSLVAKDSILFQKIKKFKYVNYNKDISDINYNLDLTNVTNNGLEELTIMFNSATYNFETVTAKNLIILNLAGCMNTYGDLKVWAERMHSLGRTSGSCHVSYTDSYGRFAKVTWNGKDLYSTTQAYEPYIVFTQEGVAIQANAPS